MEVLKLIGLGNDEKNKRSYFILKKKNLFKKSFNEILDKLNLYPPIYDEQGSIEDLENQLDHFKNDNFDIDVIYTKDRIIVIVRAEQKDLNKFKSLLLAYSKIIE
ncbi:hypothetical protein KAT24_01100 [Candidatus Pacearchaeota archaeon]|nr:hypothetical protein [Candidatus Pacearchaeota archaeon]